MGTAKDSMTMKLRVRKRTSSLGVRLIGMATLVLVRVLTAGVGGMYGRYEDRRIWEEFEGDG